MRMLKVCLSCFLFFFGRPDARRRGNGMKTVSSYTWLSWSRKMEESLPDRMSVDAKRRLPGRLLGHTPDG